MGGLIPTEHAMARYRDRVARRRIGLGRAAEDLRSSAELFRVPHKDGGEVVGLRDPHGRPFAGVVERGWLVTVGPPHFWSEARTEWGKAGLDWERGRWRRSPPAPLADGLGGEPSALRAVVPAALHGHLRRYLSGPREGTLVRAVLRDGAGVCAVQPPHLDSILAWAVWEEAHRGERGPAQEPAPIPLPLTCLALDPRGWPLWAASCLHPMGPEVRDAEMLHKRSPEGRWTHAPKGRPLSVDVSTGRYMGMSMPRSLVRCREWVGLCHGDPDEVRRLLASVPCVGKKRSLNWGEVERWEVEPTGLPPEACLHDGARLLRPLPEWAAEAGGLTMAEPPSPAVGWTPPNWRPGLFAAGWRCGAALAERPENDG